MTEHDLQVSIMQEVALRANLDPTWGLIFAIPNGGHRNKAVAGKLKAEGVKAGVLDLCLPVARRGYHGMFMELKVGKNKMSAIQQEWYTRLRAEGNYCTVVWDYPASAIQEFEWYINGANA
jgi:hypothetical protein